MQKEQFKESIEQIFGTEDRRLKKLDIEVPNLDLEITHNVYVGLFNYLPSRLSFQFSYSYLEEFLNLLKDRKYVTYQMDSTIHSGEYISVKFLHRENVELIELSEVVFDTSPPDVTTSAGNNPFIPSDTTDSQQDEKCRVEIFFSRKESLGFIQTLLDKFNKVEDTAEDNKHKVLFMEKNAHGSICFNHYKIQNFDIDIKTHYNDDFEKVDTKIKEWISDFKTPNQKLVLLHGIPGSGKTNYIKHLLNDGIDVPKIYIPPCYIDMISDPAFFSVIKQQKNSVLIIEDAEKVLMNREDTGGTNAISVLLNLCDGILAGVLNFKIIATFNVDEDQIDPALKRKGRMFLKYKFGKLSEEKTRKLYKDIHNVDSPPEKEMNLADIYNDQNSFGKTKEDKSIGFFNV